MIFSLEKGRKILRNASKKVLDPSFAGWRCLVYEIDLTTLRFSDGD